MLLTYVPDMCSWQAHVVMLIVHCLMISTAPASAPAPAPVHNLETQSRDIISTLRTGTYHCNKYFVRIVSDIKACVQHMMDQKNINTGVQQMIEQKEQQHQTIIEAWLDQFCKKYI